MYPAKYAKDEETMLLRRQLGEIQEGKQPPELTREGLVKAVADLQARVEELERMERRHGFIPGEHTHFCVCGLPRDAVTHEVDLRGLVMPHVYEPGDEWNLGLCGGCGFREGHDVHYLKNDVHGLSTHPDNVKERETRRRSEG